LSILPPNVIDFDVLFEDSNWPDEPHNNFINHHYHSMDGGRTWTSKGVYESAQFMDAEVGWTLLASAPGGLALLQRTDDGGKTWTTIKRVAWEIAQFDFVDGQTGWAVASSGNQSALVHTTDGGLTWEEIKPVLAP
jgi:photosystem II stability/assembly factor-like uncharacterized protein